MIPDNIFDIIVPLGLVFLAIMLVANSRLPRDVRQLLCIALTLRVVGATLRYRIAFDFYTGGGDFVDYYRRGTAFAEYFRNFDLTPVRQVIDASGPWWGTDFLRLLSGVVIVFTGPSMFAEFIVFSLMSFVGLVGFAVAFRRSYPDANWTNYLIWLWLFPSLWFWPSSVGKEAVIMFGLGLAVMGFIGKQGKIQWVLLFVGMFFIYAIRPQVATIVLASMLVSQWLSFSGGWTSKRIVQTVVVSIIALFGIHYATGTLGIDLDPGGVQSYVEEDPARRAEGKTHVDPVGTTILSTPIAVTNILLRPFLWEATNVMVAVSSLEVMFLILILYLRRRNLSESLRLWRSDRFLRLALVFLALYPVGLGMMVINMGIIARQRVFIFPFLFLLLEAVPRKTRGTANQSSLDGSSRENLLLSVRTGTQDLELPPGPR